jgi:hypothetical protein
MTDGYAEEPKTNANVINFNDARDKVKSDDLIKEYFDESIDNEYHYMDYEHIKFLEEEERYINNVLFGATKPMERAIKRLENGQAIIMLLLFLQATITLAIWLTNI